MSEMLSVEKIAKQFNVCPKTVVRLIENRELQALRVGRQWRIRKEWLDAWIDRNTSRTKDDVG